MVWRIICKEGEEREPSVCWITEELDDGGRLLIGKAVDDEPFLGKGCAVHGNVEEVADGAAASITGE